MTSSTAAELDPPVAPQILSVPLPVPGELDAHGTERLRALFDDEIRPGRRLVLDLSGVDHLSSAALAALVAAHCRLRDSRGSLVLAAPSPAVVRVLRISGLHRVLQTQA